MERDLSWDSYGGGGEEEVALKPENLSLPYAAAFLTAEEVRKRLEEILSKASW